MNLYVGLKFKTKADPEAIGEIQKIESGLVIYSWNNLDIRSMSESQVEAMFEYFGWYKLSRLEEVLI